MCQGGGVMGEWGGGGGGGVVGGGGGGHDMYSFDFSFSS